MSSHLYLLPRAFFDSVEWYTIPSQARVEMAVVTARLASTNGRCNSASHS